MPSAPEHAPAGFVEVRIEADSRLLDELAGLISQLGFEGFWEEGTSLRCYMRTSRWEPGLLAEVEAVARVTARHAEAPLPRVSVATLAEENWNERWEKTIRPIRITDRIVVAPSWDPYTPTADEIVLTIDPKMSFGTGYHESTRLAARLCERFLLPGSSVLDVGTGTGILGIAAARLGARRVVAVDTDEWAYRNARENVTRNNVDAEVTVIQGGPDMGGAGPYDMILANIQRSVIRDILPLLSTRLSQDGLIVVAGLLEAEEEAMMHTFRTSGLMVVARLAENEWLSFALRRGGTA